jgi:hypothetical protein
MANGARLVKEGGNVVIRNGCWKTLGDALGISLGGEDEGNEGHIGFD